METTMREHTVSDLDAFAAELAEAARGHLETVRDTATFTDVTRAYYSGRHDGLLEALRILFGYPFMNEVANLARNGG